MQEIFEDVLKKEQEAQRLVTEAQEQARLMAAQAEKTYAAAVKTSREKMRLYRNDSLEALRAEQDQRVKAALDEYDREENRRRADRESRVDALAQTLTRVVAEI